MGASANALLLLLVFAAPAALATDYTVGGSSGWDSGVDYSTWVSGKTFKAGDNLVFSYASNHKVDEVSKSDYESCSSGNALQSHSDGNTKIALTKAGTRYFLCPTLGHCGNGMKLAVTVAAAGGSSSGAAPVTPSSPTAQTPSGGDRLRGWVVGAWLLWVPLVALLG